MPLDLSAVGRTSGPNPVEWNSRDAIIYALGVGAGAVDPYQELAFTTENSHGIAQQVIPSFALVISPRGVGPISIGTYDPGMTVHGEQGLTLHAPLPADGRGFTTNCIEAIYDKGKGALVIRSMRLTDADGRPLATARIGQFIRGEGGFGGDPGPRFAWAAPDREPDHTTLQPTRPDQALLYRLTGDRNPLHTDPVFAARVGFAKPILHGMCSFGFACRAILALVDHDPARFKSMNVRFSQPVIPGETMRTTFWIDGTAIRFRCFVGDRMVLDAGEAEIA